MKKLPEVQLKILTLMSQGWEMGVSTTESWHCWLQRDGIGKGGPTEPVNGNTFHSLVSKKLIRQKVYGFPTSVYELTDAGRKEVV